MTRGKTTGPEQAIDAAAAAGFALCAAWSLRATGVAAEMAGVAALAAGALAFLGLGRVAVGSSRAFFAPLDLVFEEPADDTLLLEDRLVEPAQDSQVVRLFAVGGGAGPHVPGELAARIDHFLGDGRPALRAVPAQPDATDELYEALAQIRRTLR